jgi:hypothetical protein
MYFYFEPSGPVSTVQGQSFPTIVATTFPVSHPSKGVFSRLGKRFLCCRSTVSWDRDGDVTKVAAAKRSLSRNRSARRTGRKQLNHASQRNVLRAMQFW